MALLQKVSLQATNIIQCGLSWDAEKKNEKIDLDLSGVFFNGFGKTMDAAYFKKLITDDGSMNLTEDSRDGTKSGEDEELKIFLDKIHHEVIAIIISISCHSDHSLKNIYSASINIKDHANIQIHKMSLSDFINSIQDQNDYNSLISYCIFRDPEFNGSWSLQPILKPCYGKTFDDFKEDMRQSLFFLIHPGLMEEFRLEI